MIILGVAVGIGAPLLKEPGKRGGGARPRVAAVLVGLVHGAGVVAAAGRTQLVRALPVDVGRAPNAPSAARGVRAELHGHVESVHQRDVEEIKVIELVECVFG